MSATKQDEGVTLALEVQRVARALGQICDALREVNRARMGVLRAEKMLMDLGEPTGGMRETAFHLEEARSSMASFWTDRLLAHRDVLTRAAKLAPKSTMLDQDA